MSLDPDWIESIRDEAAAEDLRAELGEAEVAETAFASRLEVIDNE